MATFQTSSVQRETPGEPFTVECESGNEYTFNHPKTMSALDIAYLSTDNIPGSLQAILGDNFVPFMDEPEMDGYAIEAVFEAWMAHFSLGENRGNGSAQRGSSTGKATPKRSKPTSRTTTRARTR